MSRDATAQRDRRGVDRARQIRALLGAWLTIDLFGKSRRSGERGTGTLTTVVFSQGFLSYAFAALAFEDIATVPFLAGTLSVVAGFTALAMLGEIQDQVGHPADRDFVQACAIRRSTFAIARTLHVTLFLALFCTGLALAPAILAAFKTGSFWIVPLYLVAALLLSGVFTASIQLPVMLVTRLGGEDAGSSFSALVRAVLFGGGFLGLLLGFQAMHRGPEQFPGGLATLQAIPSYWVAKLLAGHAQSPWIELCVAAPLGLGLLTFVIWKVPARRSAGRSHSASWLDRVIGRASARPVDRGTIAFTTKMLMRERSFRLRALPVLGLPATAVILWLRRELDPQATSFFLALAHNLPLAYAPFLMFFLPYAENWRASWIIEASVARPVEQSRHGVAVGFGLLAIPLQGMLLLIDLAYRDFASAAATTLTALAATWIALPLLARTLQRTPFSEPPEDLAPPGELGPPVVIAVAAAIGAVATEALPPVGRYPVAIAAAALGWFLLTRGVAGSPGSEART